MQDRWRLEALDCAHARTWTSRGQSVAPDSWVLKDERLAYSERDRIMLGRVRRVLGNLPRAEWPLLIGQWAQLSTGEDAVVYAVRQLQQQVVN